MEPHPAWWLPAPLLAAGILGFRLLPLPMPVRESRALLAGLNLTFYAAMLLLATALLTRRLGLRRRPGQVLFVFGIVVWSGAGIASVNPVGDLNQLITVHNLGLLVASLCQLAGVMLELRSDPAVALRRTGIRLAYAAALALVGLIVLAVTEGWTEVYFVPGQGGTLARQLSLATALAAFAVTAGLLHRHRRDSRFAAWCSMALGLTSVGLLGNLLQRHTGGPINWLGRFAHYLGGAYLALGALAALRRPGRMLRAETREDARPMRWVIPTLLVAAATALRLTLMRDLGIRALFGPYYPVVVVSALLGGLGPGLVAVLVGGAAVQWAGPPGLPTPAPLDHVLYFLSGLVITVSIEAMHRARARAARAEARALASAVREEGAAALRRTVDELTRSNHDLEQFAYVASHDLQEPARMIHAYVGLLRDRFGDLLDAQGREYLAFAQDNAARMQALIRDLLAYARLDAARPAPAPVPLQPCLDQAVADLRAAIAEAGAEVSWDPLPTALADPSLVTQVLANLVGNALKFRAAAPPRVHVGATSGPGLVTVWVRDNGIGIDPQAHAKIFDIFQRLHTRERYPGTGIGLAICKKIVEGHGGRIWVVSEAGAGAEFRFTLPAPAEAP